MLEADRMDLQLKQGGPNEEGKTQRTVAIIKESNVLGPQEQKFIQNCNMKVFKRFNLDPQEQPLNASGTNSKVSLKDIIMQNWTGSKVYEMAVTDSDSSLDQQRESAHGESDVILDERGKSSLVVKQATG